jgi:glycosyltransferase involved in cell wall biosynthesis
VTGGRVLHLLKGLGPGGAEHLLVAGAPHRSERFGHVEVAYLLPWKNQLVPALEAHGVVTHCLHGASPADPRWIARLVTLLRRQRFDLVHLHSPLPAALARPVLRALPGRPVVVSTEHNSWASHAAGTRRANTATFALGDAWIAVSEPVRQSMPIRFRARTEVIVHGIDTAAVAAHAGQREAVRAQLGLASDDVAVITVANLRRQKAYPDLLAAARDVVDRNPAVRFFAVGQGPLETELHAERDRLGLGERFTFLGYRDDPHRLLAAMDVYALASHHEGLPLALMEAFAAGLPVVATAVGGVPDVVEPDVSGLLVPPAQPEQLATALLRVVADPGLRRTLGAGAATAAGRFDVARSTAQIEAVYERALARALDPVAVTAP